MSQCCDAPPRTTDHAPQVYPQIKCNMTIWWGVLANDSIWNPIAVVLSALVHRAPAQPICRRGTARAHRNLRMTSLDEPMEVRARHVRGAYFLPSHHPAGPRSCSQRAMWCRRSHAVRAVGTAIFVSGALPSITSHQEAVEGGFSGGRKVRDRHHASNTCLIRPVLCASHVWLHAFRGSRHVYARRGGR